MNIVFVDFGFYHGDMILWKSQHEKTDQISNKQKSLPS